MVGGMSLSFLIKWSMRERISWAENGKGHRKHLHPTAPSIPPKSPTLPASPLVSGVSPDLGIAIIFSTAVLVGEKLLLLWEGTKMQAYTCASQLLPCAVNAGSTSRPKAEARETGHGSPELGPCTGQQSKALVELPQMLWCCHLLVILLSLGAALMRNPDFTVVLVCCPQLACSPLILITLGISSLNINLKKSCENLPLPQMNHELTGGTYNALLRLA